jgi:carbon starvation protein
MTIPIALFIGIYLKRYRKGRVLEASIIGGLLTLVAVWAGAGISNPESFLNGFKDYFDLTQQQVGIAMAVYGFIAAVLPVSVLLCPRDYLSSFLKLGTIALLVIGVILAHPQLQAPALNHVFLLGGPTVKGSIFPFVFITIMCGAISGFHALVASGTTPKMVNNERDMRTIGYGAMLMEGLVGIVALIAASALPTSQFYDMNTAWKDMPAYQQDIAKIAKNDTIAAGQTLPEVEKRVGENLEGRTGGAVTLAVGMARIFDDAAKGILGRTSAWMAKIEAMMPYWYHFAIMFEALFILTTIDAGTRVGRFLLQETLGKWVHPKFAQTAWWPSTLITTALVVAGWYYFIDAIWPMFGVSNQLLAVMALAVATVAIVRSGKGRYAWVTIAPMFVVTTTTLSAAAVMLRQYGAEVSRGLSAGTPWGDTGWVSPLVSGALILAIIACTLLILLGAFVRMRRPMRTEDGAFAPASESVTVG